MTRRLAPAALLAVLCWTVPLQAADQVVTRIRVIVPFPTATLKIDGTPTRLTGTDRSFDTPPIERDAGYSYTLVARWEPNNYTTITRTRVVKFKGGETPTFDLRQPDPARPDDVIVRYVPTPMEVVEKMLELAQVKKGDVVYDLGCGDGRIVVTAVSKYGAARGVGIDYDPERIKDSEATRKAAGLTAKDVLLRQQNVLEIKDYSDANVVMLYMGNDLNLGVRPALRKTLKPGSRVVSHRFTMGDWEPDRTIKVRDKAGEEYLLHLWTITDKDAAKDK